MKSKEIYQKINAWLNKIDEKSLWLLGVFVVATIMAPILYLGKGAVFPFVDQLDETLLNYIFPARYREAEFYDAIMCGYVGREGLKPFAPFFVPLYSVFEPFLAFVVQYALVIITAWFGTYFAVKEITDSSISSVLAASVFALLPFRSVYGNLLSGIPLLVYCVIRLNNEWKNKKIWTCILLFLGLVYYALSTSLVLSGYAVIIVLSVIFVIKSISDKRICVPLVFSTLSLGIVYAFCNLDLLSQIFSVGNFVSHREEFVIKGVPFLNSFRDIMLTGIGLNESFHKFIYIPVVVALPFVLSKKQRGSKKRKAYFGTVITIMLCGTLYAFFLSEFVADIRNSMSGMLKSFQFQRFGLLTVGLWYILLGISLAAIIRGIKKEHILFSLVLAFAVYVPTLLFVAKNPDCILYQNVNQINNRDITGYITWESLYSENMMEKIKADIGEDISSYRVGHIGICPVVSLYNGFYTIDGYSNNYALEYKHKFAETIAPELAKNDYSASYFYDWGNRCYLFYHDFGTGFSVGKTNNALIDDYSFDTEKMKNLGCKYIFSAGEISNFDERGLSFFGEYTDDVSFWNIWVYSIE